MAGTVDEPKTLIEELQSRKTLLSVSETAELLRESTTTIYRRSKRGKLPCLRFGSTVRFDPLELAQWLTSKHCG